jgi:hypothetical protein
MTAAATERSCHRILGDRAARARPTRGGEQKYPLTVSVGNGGTAAKWGGRKEQEWAVRF